MNKNLKISVKIIMPLMLTILTMLMIFFTGCNLNNTGGKEANALDGFLKRKSMKESVNDSAINVIDETAQYGQDNQKDKDMVDHIIDENYMNEDKNNNIPDMVMSTPKTPQTPKGIVKQDYNRITKGNRISVVEIKGYLKKGLYKVVVDSYIDHRDPIAQFYSGIANFCLAKKYRGFAKDRYITAAARIFKEVGIKCHNKEIRSKSILWHGITMYKFQLKKIPTETLLKPYYFIQKNLKNTKCYNDSLLYAGLVLLRKGEISRAKDYLNKLNNTKLTDKVYDIDYKKWVRPMVAANFYLKMKSDIKSEKTILKENNSAQDLGEEKIVKNNSNKKNEEAPSAFDKETQKIFNEKIEKIHQEIIEEENADDPQQSADAPDDVNNNANNDNNNDTLNDNTDSQNDETVNVNNANNANTDEDSSASSANEDNESTNEKKNNSQVSDTSSNDDNDNTDTVENTKKDKTTETKKNDDSELMLE